MAKYMVLGGAGFIGSHVVEQLVQEGHQVVVVDDLSRGKRNNLPPLVPQKTTFIEADVTERNIIGDLFRIHQPGYIMNLAAKVTGISYNLKANYDMAWNNLMCGLIPLHAALMLKCQYGQSFRFLSVSTACIYPHDAPVPTPENAGEPFNPEPTNRGYGLAKRFVEEMGRYATREYGLDIVIARPINAAGLRDYYDKETSHVIPALIRRTLEEDDPIVVWGTGRQTRSFLDAQDFAKGLILTIQMGKGGEVYNVGHNRQITIKDLAYKIRDLCESKARIVFDNSKPDGYPERGLDGKKLKDFTGWEPEIPLEQTLKNMIMEYQNFLRKK